MDFNREIVQFVSDKLGGITIIAEASGRIEYADKFFVEKYGDQVEGLYSEDVYMWLGDCPKLDEEGAVTEWESIDTEAKKYYKFNSAKFKKEDRTYVIHQLVDITEYMGLNRDITKYMAFFKKLSGFQSAVLEKLSTTFYELLPMIADYFKTSKAYFMVQHEGNMDIITYTKMGNIYSNDRVNLNAAIEKAFKMEQNVDIDLSEFAPEIQEVISLNGQNGEGTYCMLCSGVVDGQQYAVYLNVWPNTDRESMREKALLSVIRLYIENGIMQEKLRYESEHDRLTGLYNKGKYIEMSEERYGTMDSIGIFNFDVNNLKVMNDTYGHEAGDKLLIKAANSIRKVTSDRVHGYRMGGDEYLMIACNVTKAEVDSLKERWEKELERLNTADDGINCVMAVGVVYGEQGYDYQALFKEADALMYEDKKKKKKPGEEIR